MNFYLFFLLLVKGLLATEEYSEEFLSTILPSNAISLVNRFITTASVKKSDYDFLYIPLTLRQLLADNVEEFHFSMTSGFWRSKLWGLQPQNEAPTGISLKVKFSNMSDEEINKAWSLLVKKVNGIFCSSILEMDPAFTAVSNLHGNQDDARLYRYGHLSGEPVCTENIHPFLRLLPCVKNGFVTMIDLDDLYMSPYYTLNIGVHRKMNNGNQDWRVELFSHYVMTKGRVHISPYRPTDGHTKELVRNTNSAFRSYPYQQLLCPLAKKQVLLSASNGSSFSSDLSIVELSSLAQGQVGNFDVPIYLGRPTPLSPSFSLYITHEKADFRGGVLSTDIFNEMDAAFEADYHHVIPWMLNVELSSLVFVCTTQGQENVGTILKKDVTPSLIRGRPLLIYFRLLLPARSKCTLKLAFTNHLMTALSYPPDSNYGIFVPGPVLSVDLEESLYMKSSSFYGSFLFSEKESRERFSTTFYRTISLHGEPLLVLLPVPDFSMPFNVISIVTTAGGFLFGSVYNLSVKCLLPDLTSDDSKKSNKFAFLSKISGIFKKA